MESLQKSILKTIITKYVNKKFRNPVKQRKFLIDCIGSSGYIQEYVQEYVEEPDNFEDLYQYMIPSENLQLENLQLQNNHQLQQTFMEQQQSSIDPYGFNRTFIHANSQTSKLVELQKRGITYEETQFNKVKEEMERLVHMSLQKNIDAQQEKIIETALNIFMNIVIYYNTNPYGFAYMKGSLKRGYIFLSVYYSLIYNGYDTDLENLIQYSEKTRLKDIPQADKNIRRIFGGVHGYSFLNKKVQVNPGNFLSKSININPSQLIQTIENVVEETRNFIPLTKLSMYSIIYFVCNEYLPYKVKIEFNNAQTRVTYKVLDQIFGNYSSATVRKIIDKILQFYKK